MKSILFYRSPWDFLILIFIKDQVGTKNQPMVDVSPGERDGIRRGRRRTLSMKCENRSNFSRTRVQNPIPKEDEVRLTKGSSSLFLSVEVSSFESESPATSLHLRIL